jgi:hypothetical protein
MLIPDYTKQFFLSETVHTQTFFLNKKHDRRKKVAQLQIYPPRPSGGVFFWIGRISPSKLSK